MAPLQCVRLAPGLAVAAVAAWRKVRKVNCFE